MVSSSTCRYPSKQEVEAHRLRELRCLAEAAEPSVERADEVVDGLGEHVLAGNAPFSADAGRALDRLGELAGLFVELVALGAPCVVDGVQEIGEAGHPVPALGREVGAAVERAAVVV